MLVRSTKAYSSNSDASPNGSSDSVFSNFPACWFQLYDTKHMQGTLISRTHTSRMVLHSSRSARAISSSFFFPVGFGGGMLNVGDVSFRSNSFFQIGDFDSHLYIWPEYIWTTSETNCFGTICMSCIRNQQLNSSSATLSVLPQSRCWVPQVLTLVHIR